MQEECRSETRFVVDTFIESYHSFYTFHSSTGEVRHLVREIVLLTTDRNLRVKALTNDIPVRELHDFIKWAGLGGNASSLVA